MKLLLTSSGITNKSIAKALFDLVGKKPEDTSLAFIPTAANVEAGDKDWLIDDLIRLKNENIGSIDIVDISALPKENWLPRLESSDVLYFEGGSTHYLMDWINKSGLVDLLEGLLKTRIYVGSSAGSCVTNKDVGQEIGKLLYDEDITNKENVPTLNFVDFYFLPHFDSQWFPKLKEENIREAIKGTAEKIYALDDQSALKVVDGKVEVISEGKYLEFN
jgi:dipeptidase E